MDAKLINSKAKELTANLVLLQQEEKAQILYQAFMNVVGIPHSDHSLETPKRVAKFFKEFTTGYKEPDFNITTFKDEQKRGQLIVVRGIEFYSLCAHHHLPFYGTADFAYISNGEVVGLSKIPRIIQHVAKKPTTQEDLSSDIVNLFSDSLNPYACGAVLKAKHMCMSMRGVQCQGAETETSFSHATRTYYEEKINKALNLG